MGCCQSEHPMQNGDFKSEIVTYEKKEENSNIFEDNFYLDSVERYNVKYKPPAQKQNSDNAVNNQLSNSHHATAGQQVNGNNANINGGSGASGGQNQAIKQLKQQ
eukprot:403331345